MKRKVVHITPDGNKGWNVKSEGSERAVANYGNKTDAISRGKEVAKNALLGQIKIHGMNGRIQTEHTYGNDPEKYKG